VAGDAARFFANTDEFSARLDEVLPNAEVLAQMKVDILRRYQEAFTWERVLADYETLLLQWLPKK